MSKPQELEIAIDYYDKQFWCICDGCGREQSVPDDDKTGSVHMAAKDFYKMGWRHDSDGIHCLDCSTEDQSNA